MLNFITKYHHNLLDNILRVHRYQDRAEVYIINLIVALSIRRFRTGLASVIYGQEEDIVSPNQGEVYVNTKGTIKMMYKS